MSVGKDGKGGMRLRKGSWRGFEGIRRKDGADGKSSRKQEKEETGQELENGGNFGERERGGGRRKTQEDGRGDV